MQPSRKPTTSPNKAPIRDRALLLIEAKVLLQMFCEAGEEDGYTEKDLLPYFERMMEQVERVRGCLRK